MTGFTGNNEKTEGSDGQSLGFSDELLAETYDLLRRMASRQLSRRMRSPTLNTTLIVHEAWMKLSRDEDRRFNDRDHYLATASQAMRQVLVDHARRKLAEKRGSGAEHVDIADQQIADRQPESQFLDIDAALKDLSKNDPELVRLVECRFFAGLTVEETARVMGKSARTVERNWARARAYLADYLEPEA